MANAHGGADQPRAARRSETLIEDSKPSGRDAPCCFRIQAETAAQGPLRGGTRKGHHPSAHRGTDALVARRRLMLLVDTNVLVDVFQDDPDWADWSIGQLRAQARIHQLAIDGIVYAELSAAFVRYEELDDVGVPAGPRAARHSAPRAVPRRKGLRALSQGEWREIECPARLPDRGHAAVEQLPLLMRDVRRYRSYFPGVRLLAPRNVR